MLGLPGEREEDLEGIVDLAHKTLRTAKNQGQVTVSLSTFVPKPHTPFQWQRQIGIEETTARQGFFRRRLKNRNISVKWHDARMSLLEGVISRGGEETGALIETAFRLGCRFDGWSDRFRFDLWEEALRRTGSDIGTSLRERSPAEAFPWDSIDCGVSREFLLSEAEKAQKGEPTPDCRAGSCNQCGACDHRTVRTIIAPADAPVGTVISSFAGRDGNELREKAFRLRFTKLGQARFLSHLELSTALSRAMILGGLSFIYSQGFHPHPKISFAGATSVGMESKGEFADIRIQEPAEDIGPLVARINAALPSGVAITAMRELPANAFSLAELVMGFDYDLVLPEDVGEAELVRIETGDFPVSRRGEFRRCPRSERKADHQGDPSSRDGPCPGPAFSPDPSFGPFRSERDGPSRRDSHRRYRFFRGGISQNRRRQDRNTPRRFRRSDRPGNLGHDAASCPAHDAASCPAHDAASCPRP